MVAATVVFVYLAVVLYVGIFAFRKKQGAEEFFVANRSLGTFVFLLSLFGSNMTSFAILGSSGLAFKIGIGVYGQMASISGIIIPLSIFLIGTRLWSIGKRFGHITQVQILRDRFEMAHIGTLVFALQAAMLVPYIIIGVMGGGETLEGVSGGRVPYWFGGLIVALVVMSYVFFGGMRGTALVNTLQTLMFLTFGTIAFYLVARGMGGIRQTVQSMAATLEPTGTAPADPRLADGAQLTRARIQPWAYISYMFIPLSSIMFPHIAIFCLTAKKLASFKKTVILYPLCIMAIWLPAVFLGAVAGGQPGIVADLAARSDEVSHWLDRPAGGGTATTPAPIRLEGLLAASKDPRAPVLLADVRAGGMTVAALGPRLAEIKDRALKPELRRLAATNADGIMLRLLDLFAPAALAGLLGAAIMACVMASDSQILALSTMFSEDVFAFYGGKLRFGEQAQVWSARVFVVLCTVVAYVIALAVHGSANIFHLAITYAFSGYASLAPIMLACLFWRRATKWGVLASALWIAVCMIGAGILQARTQHLAPPPTAAAVPVIVAIGDIPVFMREATSITFTSLRMLLVAPMFIGSALLMVVVSWLTPRPSAATIEKYFPTRIQAREPLRTAAI